MFICQQYFQLGSRFADLIINIQCGFLLTGFMKMFWRTDLVVARDEWIRPKNVPECLLLHLETFMWEGYIWEQEDGIEVAKYILSNTNHLKTATFSSIFTGSEARLLVVKDLISVLKDTNSCQIQFKW